MTEVATVPARFVLLMAFGLGSFLVPFILPFIAGLCGFGRRFVYIYLPILAVYLALSFAWTFTLFRDFQPQAFRSTGWGLVFLSGVVFYAFLTELAKAVGAYFCGLGLRALTLRIVRHFRSSRRSVRRQRTHPGARAFGESVTCGPLRQRGHGAFADHALAERLEKESREEKRRLPPSRW